MRATTACTFSTSQLPKLVRTWCVLYILTSKCASSKLSKVLRRWGVLTLFTSKCASRHNGGQFFIFYLTSRLRTRHFREPTFRPSEPQNNVKTHCFATSTFSRTCIFALLAVSFPDVLRLLSSPFWLSPFWLSPCLSCFLDVLFHLSILSEVWPRNFLRLCTYVFVCHMMFCEKMPKSLELLLLQCF